MGSIPPPGQLSQKNCGGGGGGDEYTRMVEEGKVIERHAHEFEGSLIALRSDSLQIYTRKYIIYNGGD
jgi:hypothetical protein